MPTPAQRDLWYDFSYTKLDPDTPCAGIIGYVSTAPTKNLSGELARQFLARGKRVLLVWQQGKTGPLGGYAQGVADAREADRQADALGYPADAPIIYACDFAPTATQMATVVDYYRGVKAASRRPWGPYGSYTVIDRIRALGPALLWQTKAWSYGRAHPEAHLLQEAGDPFYGVPAVDANTVLRPFRAWGDLAPAGPVLAAPAVAVAYHFSPARGN